MSVDSFRLNSFRPWNPFQDKVQILRDSLDICQYPSPVSITATSPLSDSSNSAPKSTNVHSCESVRHPLPPRPPSEVCLKDSLPEVINTQHQSAVEDQIPCVNPGLEAFDFDDILQLPDLPSSGDQDDPMICHDLGSELACITSQRSNVGNAGSFGVTRECSDATIDPAILNDDQIQDIEQTPARNETSDVVSPYFPSGKRVSGPSMRPHSQRTTSPRRQRSKVSKVAVVVNNRHMNKAGRSTRADRPVATSFSALRDQFSSLPVEERLQFLSWLFEGALSQCLHRSTNSHDASPLGFVAGDADPLTPSVQSLPDANAVDVEPSRTSRKGLPFSAEEDRLLVKLRREENLAWSEVVTRFSQRFPGRSKGSIQVHWSTRLKKPTAVLN